MNTYFNIINIASITIRNTKSNFLAVSRNTFHSFSLITLLFIGLSSTTVKADNHLGGFIVMVQGLTDEDIVVTFSSQKTGYKNTTVNLMILSADGALVYEIEATDVMIDLSSISLEAGDYIMHIAVEQNVETITFSSQ